MEILSKQSQRFIFKDYLKLLKNLVSEELPFRDFERQYWTIYNEIPESLIPKDKVAIFDDIYEMMYMCEEDPVADEDKKYGFLGHQEIRRRIAAHLKTLTGS